MISASVVLSSNASIQCSMRGAITRKKNSREPEPASRSTQSLCSKSLMTKRSCCARG
ncbi:Uncharacterised protein [Vibrio cholerae]|nr:Uncharacterised protein [Vibrio cholerae]